MATSSFNPDRVIIAVLALLVLVLGFFLLQKGRVQDGYSAEGMPAADFSVAAEKVMPTLVKVENEVLTTHPPIAGLPEAGQIAETREGTGFFIDRQGLILTNYHVVAGAARITVTFTNGASYDAKVVGTDPNTDLAVVQVTGAPGALVKPITVGDSSQVKVGEMVIAIGVAGKILDANLDSARHRQLIDAAIKDMSKG